MSYQIQVSHEATPADREAILTPLRDHNQQHGPPTQFLNLALRLRTPDGRDLPGGLWGRTAYDWLFVEYLAVPPEFRGTGAGTALMRQAEQWALAHHCIGVWLDTFSFQALPFYEKLGYERCGQIDDNPIGGARYFLKKRLA